VIGRKAERKGTTMRNRHVTGVSKRHSKDMCLEAIRDAMNGLSDIDKGDAKRYVDQLNVGALTQDQLIALETLFDMAFRSGQAVGKADGLTGR